MYNAKNIGAFIAKQRSDKRLTQKDLAQLLYVKVEDIKKWENGEDLPDDVSLKYLSTIFKISLKELLNPPVHQTLTDQPVVTEKPKENTVIKPEMKVEVTTSVKKPQLQPELAGNFQPELKVEVKNEQKNQTPKNDLNFKIPLFETSGTKLSATNDAVNNLVKQGKEMNAKTETEKMNTEKFAEYLPQSPATKKVRAKENNKTNNGGKVFRGLLLFLRLLLSASIVGIIAFVKLENEFMQPMLWEAIKFTGNYTFIYTTLAVMGLSALVFLLTLFFTLFCGKIIRNNKAKLNTFYLHLVFSSLLLILVYYNYFLIQTYFTINSYFILSHYGAIVLMVLINLIYTLSSLTIKTSENLVSGKSKVEKLEVPKNWLD
jgi:transcriptional regulator with XRE-family HTH domain